VDLPEAQRQFVVDHCFLNTATVGLGCIDATAALAKDLDQWRGGRIDIYSYDDLIDRSRKAFAELVGASNPSSVAIISQLSQASGAVAAMLSPGDHVLVAEEDFTSVLFPFLVRADEITVRAVPLADLIGEINTTTTLVAVSAAQSSDGRVIDLDALAARAAEFDVLTFIDATQAAGWLPIGADRFSVTAAAGYKWMCCPRGAGLMTVGEDLIGRMKPNSSNWYGAENPWESSYGPPLRMAPTAKRFDLSPAWSAWVGAAPSLELLASVGTDTIHAHNVELANQFCRRIGIADADSAIVAFEHDGADLALERADVSAAVRQGRTRLSFHLYNDLEDVDRAASALGY
jgi:selenocysteine lyase/cysteine desulfurase